jgi:hypothetical protein
MAKKKTEEVVEQTTEQPRVDDTVEKIKVKKKPTMKKLNQDDKPIKVDLSKPPKTDEDTIKEDTEQGTTGTTEVETPETVQEVGGDVPSGDTTVQDEETPVLEEITNEEVEEKVEEVKEQVKDIIDEAEKTGEPLPDSIQKLMDFMNETGGDINDYVKLNQDYSKLNEDSLLREYYNQTKPHLNHEEINFLMEDQFSYDEDVDDERDIKRKKLALKEQVAGAKTHLDGQKSKYYEEIKAGSKLTPEQQKAIDFFNRYNEESETTQKIAKRNTNIFEQKTNEVFNNKFKGFEYNVGDKKYRFNVKDGDEIKVMQSDINNFTKKFLDKNLALNDAKGYHKSLFTAMNADAIANHFYEQGRTDAVKDSVAKAKNVDMSPRQSHGEFEAGGMKFKVLGNDASDFKFKIKNK